MTEQDPRDYSAGYFIYFLERIEGWCKPNVYYCTPSERDHELAKLLGYEFFQINGAGLSYRARKTDQPREVTLANYDKLCVEYNLDQEKMRVSGYKVQ